MTEKTADAAPASGGTAMPAAKPAVAAKPVKAPTALKPPKPATSVTARVDAAIEEWWSEHIHNSPVSQATEAYAHIHKRLDALKASVVNALKEV